MKIKHIDNYWEGNDPISIVFHTTRGNNLEGAIQTLKERGLSYNYIIYRGELYEIVHWSNSAWHAGVVHNPTLRVKKFFMGINPNKKSVGLAFVMNGEARLSQEDVDAGKEFVEWLTGETGNEYNEKNSFTHQEITSYKPKEVRAYKYQIIGNTDNKGEERIKELQLTLIDLIKLLILAIKGQNKNKRI